MIFLIANFGLDESNYRLFGVPNVRLCTAAGFIGVCGSVVRNIDTKI